MKIIKLDRRHKFYRENDMRYAVVFEREDGWYTRPYEDWLRERFGPPWTTNEWRSGWPTMYGTTKYYIAVKDPGILTMMALALGEIND
jgi:hypothetical protein